MAIGKLGKVEAVTTPTPRSSDRSERSRTSELSEKRDPRLMSAAKMYEKQFLREMVKAMRGTVSYSELTKPTMAEEIYRSQLDEEYVEAWGERGGLGLAELIHDEITDKILGAQGRDRHPGMMALSDRDIARVIRTPTSLPRQIALKVELNADPRGAALRVKAPWDSRVLATTQVDGKTTVLLEHEGGLRSAMIFDGVAASVRSGDRIAKGGVIGTLNPDAHGFFWNLNGVTASLDRSEFDRARVVVGDNSAISVHSDQGVAPLSVPAKNSGPESEP